MLLLLLRERRSRQPERLLALVRPVLVLVLVRQQVREPLVLVLVRQQVRVLLRQERPVQVQALVRMPAAELLELQVLASRPLAQELALPVQVRVRVLVRMPAAELQELASRPLAQELVQPVQARRPLEPRWESR